MLSRPTALNLSNWRQPGNNRWAFHHVREIIPTDEIARGERVSKFEKSIAGNVDGVKVAAPDGTDWSLQRWLEESNSDALLVAHHGKLVHEWYFDPAIETRPHIVFSVSKSITATLAGVLVDQGLLDPSKPVVEYIPELADSGYRDASLQQVLDMVVNIDFTEDYLATEGKFLEYRTATAWHPCPVDAIDQNLHDFLCSIERADGEHGQVWQYKSPNSDLLGWVLERASGERLASLMSRYLWQPMGAEANAYITVDRKGAARTAGGICVLPRDLLRFGELVRNRGYANGRQVIPEWWIEDCSEAGSREAWRRGESSKEFADGQYRNKWYQTGNEHRAMLAIGIHSQWIYINPVTEVTVVKLSSQDEPLKPELDETNLQMFTNISSALTP
ncbi:MAG: beta-lactamase family protein [Gammaproteobacteria bacterium]|nr:beta-lactamase family protein [Gammaproteobacteria bacterium]MDH3859236.1 beta-lactamase family protein [Gammaproteobacteria bacterium]